MKKLFLTLCILSVFPLISAGRAKPKPVEIPGKSLLPTSPAKIFNKEVIQKVDPTICNAGCVDQALQQLGPKDVNTLNSFSSLQKNAVLGSYLQKLPVVNSELNASFGSHEAKEIQTAMLAAVILSAKEGWSLDKIENMENFMAKVETGRMDHKVISKIDEVMENCRL